MTSNYDVKTYSLKQRSGKKLVVVVFDACSLLKYIGNYCCTLWLWCTHVLCEIIWFLYWKVNYQCRSYRKRKRRDRRSLWISWSLAMGAAQRDSIITSSTMLRNGELHELWQSSLLCMSESSRLLLVLFLPSVNYVTPEYEPNEITTLKMLYRSRAYFSHMLYFHTDVLICLMRTCVTFIQVHKIIKNLL